MSIKRMRTCQNFLVIAHRSNKTTFLWKGAEKFEKNQKIYQFTYYIKFIHIFIFSNLLIPINVILVIQK